MPGSVISPCGLAGSRPLSHLLCAVAVAVAVAAGAGAGVAPAGCGPGRQVHVHPAGQHGCVGGADQPGGHRPGLDGERHRGGGLDGHQEGPRGAGDRGGVVCELCAGADREVPADHDFVPALPGEQVVNPQPVAGQGPAPAVSGAIAPPPVPVMSRRHVAQRDQEDVSRSQQSGELLVRDAGEQCGGAQCRVGRRTRQRAE